MKCCLTSMNSHYKDEKISQLPRLNSLAPGRFQWNFRWVMFKLILVTDGWGISRKIALRWMPLDLTDKSTLVQVMAWCPQATSHYLQCWPRSMSPYGITRPQWVNYRNPYYIPISVSILQYGNNCTSKYELHIFIMGVPGKTVFILKWVQEELPDHSICLQWPTDLGVASIQNNYLPSHYVLSASEFPLSRYDHRTNTTIFIKGLPITTKIILMLKWIQKDLPDGSLGPQQFVCSPLGRG